MGRHAQRESPSRVPSCTVWPIADDTVSLGLSDSCLARTRKRGLFSRLVQSQKGHVPVGILGRQRQSRTSPVDTSSWLPFNACLKWTPDRPRSVATLKAHASCVYQALFSPHQPDIIATCSTDGTIKLFDLRAPAYASGPASNAFTNPVSAAVLTVPASGTELLSIDWNKYRPFVIASAGVDKVVKVFDCRMASTLPPTSQSVGGVCEIQLPGHEYAVRKVQWSPHRADILATASYDMTCRMYVVSVISVDARLIDVTFAVGILVPYRGDPTCCMYTILIPSLWQGAVGRCTTRVFWRAVVGTVGSTYFGHDNSIEYIFCRQPSERFQSLTTWVCMRASFYFFTNSF